MTAAQYRYAQHNTRKGILSRVEHSNPYLFLKMDLEGADLETIRSVLSRAECERKTRRGYRPR